MNIAQCRMARAALGWSVAELAQKSGVAPRSISRFELGEKVKAETVDTLAQALIAGGVSFIETDGRVGVLVKP